MTEFPFAGSSYYDAVLDAAALFGVLPGRFDDASDNEGQDLPQFVDRLFATARGTATLPAGAMMKWFDMNYHYLVPELGGSTTFELNDAELLRDIQTRVDNAVPVRPVLVEPATFLTLSRTTDGLDPLGLLDALIDALAPPHSTHRPDRCQVGAV